MSPDDPFDHRARHLRALYRRTNPTQRRSERGFLVIDQAQQADQTRIVREAYDRLFPGSEVSLDQILVSVWREARELAEWRYDPQSQAWLRADGAVAREGDDHEWKAIDDG